MAALLTALQAEDGFSLGFGQCFPGKARQWGDLAPTAAPFDQQPFSHRQLLIVKLDGLTQG